MEIFPARIDDARAVAQIHVRAWQAAYVDILPDDYLAALSVERREASWRGIIAEGQSQLLVAKTGDTLLGWISFGACRDEGSPASEAEIWALYASPDAWSTGVGRALWLRAKGWIAEQGFTSCSLWVFPQNERAIRFYRGAGFVADPSSCKEFRLAERTLQEVRYVRRIDP